MQRVRYARATRAYRRIRRMGSVGSEPKLGSSVTRTSTGFRTCTFPSNPCTEITFARRNVKTDAYSWIAGECTMHTLQIPVSSSRCIASVLDIQMYAVYETHNTCPCGLASTIATDGIENRETRASKNLILNPIIVVYDRWWSTVYAYVYTRLI